MTFWKASSLETMRAQPHEQDLSGVATEVQNPRTLDLDRLSTEKLVEAMHSADLDAVRSVSSQQAQIVAAIDHLTERVKAEGRIFYLGAGTSGRLGVLDAAECPPTYSSPPNLVQGVIAGGERALQHSIEGAEDDSAQAQIDLEERQFSSRDTLVGVAASGRTPYVLGGIEFARRIGAWTIGLSCVAASPLACSADLAITPATGAEIVTGSTRMKAGTATKLVLNMLSTGVMVKLGYVYGNLMVNVQPTNAKLRSRATRIIQQLTGTAYAEAEALLAHAGSVRIAIIMHRLQIDHAEAAKRLTAAKGRLRDVIG